MADLTPQIRAIHRESQKTLTVSAHPEGEAGHYVAALTLPQAGEWSWTIEAFTAIQPMPPLVVQPAVAAVAETQTPSRSWPLWVGGLGLATLAGSILVWQRRRVWWAAVPAVAAIALTGAGFATLAASPAQTSVKPAAGPSQAEIGQALFVAKGCIICHRHDAIQEIPNIFVEAGPDLTNYPTTPEYLHAWLKDPQALKPKTEMPNLELKKTEIEALIAFLLGQKSKEQVEASNQLLPAEPGSTSSAASPSQPAELFFVRSQGAKGRLAVYEMPQARHRFNLPAGLPTADWRHYYVAMTQYGNTRLERFDPATSQLEHSFGIAGRWSLSALSPSGRWLVLTRIPSGEDRAAWIQEKRWQTDIQIVDSETGRTSHSLQLDGNFEVEAVSAAGDALFLIEHRPAVNPTEYLIRLYDLAAGLQPDPLRAKTAADEVMTGLAWGGLASPDGRWLLTLYLNTPRSVAFIHTLDLENRFPFCIDLPSGGGDLAQLKHYALALAPNGQTVYAANAALGVVAEISLTSLSVIHTVEFPVSNLGTAAQSTLEIPTNYSVISADGSQLYFSNGWDIWSYDSRSKQVAGPYLSDLPVRGLGLSQDGQQLYVALDGQTPQVIDLIDSQSLGLKLN
jgi:mono/diheme cytochrome c family protein